MERKGRLDEAISDFTKTIELDKKGIKAYYNRGLIYFAKGEYGLALKDLRQVVKIDPKFLDAKERIKQREGMIGSR